MRVAILVPAAAVFLSACVPDDVPITEYRPVIDDKRVNKRRFERDLAECREFAIKLEADYKKRQEEELGKEILVGIVAGALTGFAFGAATGGNQGDFAAAGAAAGAASGIANREYTDDLVKYGPRRVVDRCMANRGYAVLNDPGRG